MVGEKDFFLICKGEFHVRGVEKVKKGKDCYCWKKFYNEREALSWCEQMSYCREGEEVSYLLCGSNDVRVERISEEFPVVEDVWYEG